MPEFQKVRMELINEPEIAARVSMDSEKFAELKDSMRDIGLILPIALMARDGRYEVVDGHRRFLAARELGWSDIQAGIFESEGQALEAMKLHANIMREDLNPAEEAIYFRELVDKYQLTEQGLCSLVHRGPAYCNDRLRLLRGDEAVFKALLEKRITFGVARELNKIKRDDLRAYYLDVAARSGYSYAVVRQWVIDQDKQALAPTATAQTEAVTPSGTASPAAPVIACFICGGHLDPYNLESVYIHRWEKDEILRVMRGEGKGGQ